MKIGKTIRNIRLSKNLKSKNIYDGILSRPAISRFERGLSDTTTEKFFKILNNLNISLEEFHFIYNNYQIEEEYLFWEEYAQAFYTNDIKKMQKLKHIKNQKYKKTKKINQLHYSALCELTSNYISGTQSDKKSLDILKTYLLECEEWTYYELVLFTNSLDFFSEELIIILYERTKKKLEEYTLLKKYNNEVFSLLSNILVIFITNNNSQNCAFFYNELSNSISETKNKMYDKVMLAFFKELIEMMNSKTYDEKKIEGVISLFTNLDMSFKAIQCTNLFETVKKNNEKSK